MALVTVDNLSVSFPGARPFRAVDGVSFAIEAGRTLALVGESGCGKTMTALGIMRLAPTAAEVTADAVTLGEVDLSRLSERDLRQARGTDVSLVFQDPLNALNPVFTVGEQVAEGLRLHEGLSRKAGWAMAVEQLREVGVPAAEQRAKQYPHELSGGLRQRAMIAMAIACRPPFLMADEPTTALDVTVQADIIDLLLRLQAERDMALLLITHDLGVVAEMAHEVAVMYAGRLVERAPANELFAAPLHPYTQDLLTSVPSVTDPTHRLTAIEGAVPDLAALPRGCAYEPRCRHAVEACREPQELAEVAPAHCVRCCRAKEWLS